KDPIATGDLSARLTDEGLEGDVRFTLQKPVGFPDRARGPVILDDTTHEVTANLRKSALQEISIQHLGIRLGDILATLGAGGGGASSGQESEGSGANSAGGSGGLRGAVSGTWDVIEGLVDLEGGPLTLEGGWSMPLPAFGVVDIAANEVLGGEPTVGVKIVDNIPTRIDGSLPFEASLDVLGQQVDVGGFAAGSFDLGAMQANGVVFLQLR